MALIEHLGRDHWREFLRDIFAYTLDVLKNDRFHHLGSAADDLRGWLSTGGIPKVKEHLNRQMEMRRFPPAQRNRSLPLPVTADFPSRGGYRTL